VRHDGALLPRRPSSACPIAASTSPVAPWLGPFALSHGSVDLRCRAGSDAHCLLTRRADTDTNRPGRLPVGAHPKAPVIGGYSLSTIAPAGQGTPPQNFGCPTRRVKKDQEAINRHLPRSPIGPLQRQDNVHRIFPAVSAARLRHPQVDSTRQEAEGKAARAGALKFPQPRRAGLTAPQDGRHGRLPTARPGRLLPPPPRATSPARPPTSPGHGWPSQPLQAGTAASVLASSKPASSRPSASCTAPWQATPDDPPDDPPSLAADIESTGNCRRSCLAPGRPEDCWPTAQPPATPSRGQGRFRLPNPGRPIRSTRGQAESTRGHHGRA
jgi:hypothetical protein